jgi:hypothetical protein
MAHLSKKTHPIRGALWGLMLGIGLAFVLVFTKVIYLSLVPILIVILAAIVVGILWGQFAPAKPPKDPEPVRVEQTPAPESSRFDDFTDTDAAIDAAPTDESVRPPPPPGTEPSPSDPTRQSIDRDPDAPTTQ